jgi:hypothetical protein
LTASDAPIQIYTITATRIIYLPVTGLTEGQKFIIWNNNFYSLTYYLNIRQGGIVIDQISAQKKVEYRWNGISWESDNWFNIQIGKNSTATSEGVAIGFGAKGNNKGVCIGGASDGSTNGCVVGYSSDGHIYGAVVGYMAYAQSYGVAIGHNANGQNSSIAIGQSSTTNNKANSTIALGSHTKAERLKEFVQTSSGVASDNKAQLTFQKYVDKDISTNAGAWQELFIDAISARLTIMASSVYHFMIQINAIDKVTFEVKTWEIKGAIKRNNANVTSLVGTPAKVVTAEDVGTTGNWDVQVTANDTSEALKIEVKHDSANQVKYSLNTFATETRI